MKIYEAIDSVKYALKSGAHPNILRIALISDGFPAPKAEVIIGWANQAIRAEGELELEDGWDE